MPVLLGSKNFYDKKIFVHGEDFGAKFNLSHAFRLFEKHDLKERETDKHGNELDRLPFLRTNFIMNKKTQVGKIGSIVRFDSIYFGMQEFFIQVETTILNDNIKFIIEVLSVFGQKEVGEVLASEEGFEVFMK
jgi:hypothetical protein